MQEKQSREGTVLVNTATFQKSSKGYLVPDTQSGEAIHKINTVL